MMEKSGKIYELDGRVPLLQAIPFGLQHVMAMFVANITPIIITPMHSRIVDNTVLFIMQIFEIHYFAASL